MIVFRVNVSHPSRPSPNSLLRLALACPEPNRGTPKLRPHKPFSCNTYETPRQVLQTKDLRQTYSPPKPFKRNTCEKHGGWGGGVISPRCLTTSNCHRHVTKIPSPQLLCFPHLQTVTPPTPLESALTQATLCTPTSSHFGTPNSRTSSRNICPTPVTSHESPVTRRSSICTRLQEC